MVADYTERDAQRRMEALMREYEHLAPSEQIGALILRCAEVESKLVKCRNDLACITQAMREAE